MFPNPFHVADAQDSDLLFGRRYIETVGRIVSSNMIAEDEPAGCLRIEAGRKAIEARERPTEIGGTTKMDADLMERIASDPKIVSGKPCVKGTRVMVSTLVSLFAVGHDMKRILEMYPYIGEEDVRAALAYAAWKSDEQLLVLNLQ